MSNVIIELVNAIGSGNSYAVSNLAWELPLPDLDEAVSVINDIYDWDANDRFEDAIDLARLIAAVRWLLEVWAPGTLATKSACEDAASHD